MYESKFWNIVVRCFGDKELSDEDVIAYVEEAAKWLQVYRPPVVAEAMTMLDMDALPDENA